LQHGTLSVPLAHVGLMRLSHALNQALANAAQFATLYISEGLSSQNYYPNRLEKQDRQYATVRNAG